MAIPSGSHKSPLQSPTRQSPPSRSFKFNGIKAVCYTFTQQWAHLKVKRPSCFSPGAPFPLLISENRNVSPSRIYFSDLKIQDKVSFLVLYRALLQNRVSLLTVSNSIYRTGTCGEIILVHMMVLHPELLECLWYHSKKCNLVISLLVSSMEVVPRTDVIAGDITRREHLP